MEATAAVWSLLLFHDNQITAAGRLFCINYFFLVHYLSLESTGNTYFYHMFSFLFFNSVHFSYDPHRLMERSLFGRQLSPSQGQHTYLGRSVLYLDIPIW